MYNIFEGHFDPLRLSKIGMAHPVVVVDFQHCIFGKTATNLSAAKEFYDGYNSGFALKWMWTSQFKIAK